MTFSNGGGGEESRKEEEGLEEDEKEGKEKEVVVVAGGIKRPCQWCDGDHNYDDDEDGDVPEGHWLRAIQLLILIPTDLWTWPSSPSLCFNL